MAPMPMKSPPTPCSKHRRKNKFPKHKTKRPAIHRIAGFAFPLRLLLQRHAAISSPHRGDFVRRKPDFVSVVTLGLFFPLVGYLLFPAPLETKSSLRLDEIRSLPGRNPHCVRTKFARFARKRRSPETISVSGLHLPWQLSTLPRRSCVAAKTGLAGFLFLNERGG